MATTKKPSQSIDATILRRIRGYGLGAVFIPGDFLDLGSRRAIDLALHRLAKKGTIRRLTRGLYDYPRTHAELGMLSPKIDAVAKALAGKGRLRLQPSGAYAANLLRLSEQVPMKVVFLTDGPSRRVKVGTREIILKRTTPRNMAAAGRTSGLVIEALRYLGKSHMTPERISTLRRLLSSADRKRLLMDLALAPAWMHPLLRAVAQGAE
jgi:uncharacterized protein DUF6088